MANESKIKKYTQHWLISNPLILIIENPNNLKLRVVLSYKGAEIIIRDVQEVIPDSEGIYKLTLTESERNLIHTLTTTIADPKLNVILRAYNNTSLTYEDTKTLDVITNNLVWTKIDGVWKKAKAHIKLTAWKKGLVWHKDSNNTWSK